MASAEDVADRLLERMPTLAAARLLAIDGPAGAGKTTFASHIAAQLTQRGRQVGTIRLDDLYDGWTGLDETLEQRVLEQVLVPLASGHGARWQAYDWDRGAFGRWHDLEPPDVLVLEGCGAGARTYAAYTTLLVWIEADPTVRADRAVARDGPGVLEQWANWSAAEDRVFARNDTRSRADVVVPT